MQQDNETDWDFIWQLAERLRLRVRGRGPARPTSASRAAAGAVELEWPKTLISFSPRVTAVQQVEHGHARRPRPEDQVGDRERSADRRPMQVAQIGIERQSVADAFDDGRGAHRHRAGQDQAEGDGARPGAARQARQRLHRRRGRRVRQPQDQGRRRWSRSRASAERSAARYRVATVDARPARRRQLHDDVRQLAGAHDPRRDRQRRPRRRPTSRASLVLGIVTNNNDPEDMGRVRVMYPGAGKHAEDAEGAWARIATASAGKERGLMMLPVVGEEVLVGFEHGDTTRPYVLGSLFNGKDTPGDDLLQEQGRLLRAAERREDLVADQEGRTRSRADGKLTSRSRGNVEEKYKADWTNETTGKTRSRPPRPSSVEGQSVSDQGPGRRHDRGHRHAHAQVRRIARSRSPRRA